MADTLKNISSSFDFVYAHHTYMFPYLKNLNHSIGVGDIHILESTILPYISNNTSFFKYIAVKYDLKKLLSCEIEAIKLCKIAFTFSEVEKYYLFSKLNIKNTKLRSVGIKIENNLKIFNKHSNIDQPIFLFFGNYKWYPNHDAFFYILEYILPKIRKYLPKARFRFVGPNGNIKMMKLANKYCAEFIGYVNSIDNEIAHSDVILAPVRIGGGVRIKILESLSKGAIVVTNSTGSEGIFEKKTLIIEDDPDDFASSCLNAILDHGLRKEKSHEAIKYIKDVHNISLAGELIYKTLSDI